MAPPDPFPLICHQQMRLLMRERHKLSCERAAIEFLRTELQKTREEELQARAARQDGENYRICECKDSHETREWERPPSYYGDNVPESSSSSLAPGTSSNLTNWSSSGSQHGIDIIKSQPELTLDPINTTDSTAGSSTSGSSSELVRRSNASLFSGSTLVAIVLLTALPAAIVVGIFFLRKRRH